MADVAQLLLASGFLDVQGGGKEASATSVEDIEGMVSHSEAEEPLSKALLVRIPKCASTTAMEAIANALEARRSATGWGIEFYALGHNEAVELCRAKAVEVHQVAALCPAQPPETEGIDPSYLTSIPRACRLALGGGQFDAAFKCAFVRNPYARCVSAWKYVGWGSTPFPEFVSMLVRRGLDSPEWTQHERMHICAQHPHVFDEDGELLVDFLGKVESMQEGLEEVCQRLGVDPPTDIPNLNAQQHDRAWQDHFSTQETKDQVFTVYARDFEPLGYTRL